MRCELLILYCEERSYFALLTLTVMFFSRKPRRHEINMRSKGLEKSPGTLTVGSGRIFGRDDLSVSVAVRNSKPKSFKSLHALMFR
jgi:hypothetical protein